MYMTITEHLVGIPGLCPCLHCLPGGHAAPAQLLLVLYWGRHQSQKEAVVSPISYVAYKNIHTPDHYYFNHIFNTICIGEHPEPTKLHADGPGGDSSPLCCIQAFPLASVFADGLK